MIIHHSESNSLFYLFLQNRVTGTRLALGVFIVFLIFLNSCTSLEKRREISSSYRWRNLKIGGGGYVTGINIHPKTSDIFIRTDVGGAYVYNQQSSSMEQMLNWVSIEESNLYGVYGIALDPVDEKHLYISAGRYPFARPSDVYESFDKGKTWESLKLNQPMGANKHPEKIGDKLVIKPLNSNELWCATFGEGLWIYDIKNKHWTKNQFDFSDNIQSILFDSANHVAYVSTIESGIYYSSDQGISFHRIPGYDWDNTDLSYNVDQNILFASSRHNGVWKLKDPLKSQLWTDITPNSEIKEYRAVTYGEGLLLTAPAKPMGALKSGFYFSMDNGDNWSLKPSKIEQTIDWHQDNFPGSAISDIVFDQKKKGRVLVSDWFSLFETDNIFCDTIVWTNKVARGHEEVVCLNMASLPANNNNISLYSAFADIAGFSHLKEETVPQFIFKETLGQNLNNLTGIAFCEIQPNVVYALGSQKHDGRGACLAVSYDFGENWDILESYSEKWGWGRLAVSPIDHKKLVLATQYGGVLYSGDGGNSFHESSFAPINLVDGPVFRYNYFLAADKVDSNYFYIYSRFDSSFYISSDFGKSWMSIYNDLPNPDGKFFKSQLDTDYWRLETVPGKSGHLFLCLANRGLYHSEDRGYHWRRIQGLEEVPLMGLGAPETERGYPAIYTLARKNKGDSLWYYRSTDKGKTFLKINSEKFRIGNNPQFIEGDRQVFGRVFIGTNGSGIVVGELNKKNQ